MTTVTPLVRIKNVARAALVVAALCAITFGAISSQPENDAQAQNAKMIIVSTPTAATEGGTNGSLTVKLSAEPSGEVDVDIKSTDTGALQLNANDPNATTGQTTVSLDFNANNYSTPQTVYLVAQSDTDGANESVTLEVEPDSDPLETVDEHYRALEKFTVSAPVNDDDQVITFNLDSSADDAAACSTLGSAIDTTNLLIVNEEDENNYCVRLGTHPSNQQNGEPKQWADAAAQAANPVTVNISSDNTDVTVSPATLNFTGDLTTAGDTSGTWRVAQSVVVSAKDDKDVTPDTETATLSHAATGGGYSLGADETDSQITVTVRDNDPGIAITEMTEGGFVLEGEQAPDVFRVSLATQDTDTSNVTVTISEVIADGATSQLSSDTLVFDNSLATFTSNIGITRTVSFTTADDEVAGEAYSPLKLKITASDGIAKSARGYGLASDPTTVFVDMTIVDDDRAPGVTIDTDPKTPGNQNTLTVDEGQSMTYTVVLDAAPTADPSSAGVQINMAIKDNKGGIFIDADASTAGHQQTIEFRSGNPGVTDSWNRWFMPRTVNIIAATDADMEDDTVVIGHTITTLEGETEYVGVTKGARRRHRQRDGHHAERPGARGPVGTNQHPQDHAERQGRNGLGRRHRPADGERLRARQQSPAEARRRRRVRLDRQRRRDHGHREGCQRSAQRRDQLHRAVIARHLHRQGEAGWQRVPVRGHRRRLRQELRGRVRDQGSTFRAGRRADRGSGEPVGRDPGHHLRHRRQAVRSVHAS